MPKKLKDNPSQIMLWADIVPNGVGFQVIPRRPLHEISSKQAAQMLNVCRASLSLIVNTELGQQHLRWRWLTDKKGKRMFEFDSVVAYRDATKELAGQ